MGIPYTGTDSMGMLGSCSKLVAKKRLRDAGLPTPDWWDGTVDSISRIASSWSPSRWIIKPIWEHASLGMDDSAVVNAIGYDDLVDSFEQRQSQMECPLFAERFIAGREFNLSILLGEVLPPAEIDFSTFPSDKPQIVGHKAKWDTNSFEYQQTPRRFAFPSSDGDLLRTLRRLAVECWDLFGLSGFARVDFRVDQVGCPWILEVNVNPCLSPDAGFAAAVAEAGYSFTEVLDRLIQAVVPSHRNQRLRSRVFA
jgi:D-alanine-D-alanine ligase